MQKYQLLALSGLAAMIGAVPAPAPMPAITPAPVPPKAADIAARQYSCDLTMEAAPSTNALGVLVSVSNCGCVDGFTTQAPGTIINNTPMVTCGTVTVRDPSPSEVSAQPLVSNPAVVPFGDLNPVDIISSISASCANGCAGTTTTVTATTTPSPVFHDSIPTTLAVEYVVTTDIFPEDTYGVLMQGLSSLMTGSLSSDTFEWTNRISDYDTVTANTTQYYGPSQLQFTRFTQDTTGAYVGITSDFSFAITSEVVEAGGVACSTIEAPLFAALSLIPDVGPILGLFGSVVCHLFGQ